MPPLLQAIVFDYDGVLADTEALHLRTFQETLAAVAPDVSLTRAEYYERYLGFDDDGVFRAIARDHELGWDDEAVSRLVADKAARYADLAAQEPVLYPGVAERLREWSAKVPIAIASGSLRQEIEVVLQHAGLTDLQTVVVAAGETARCKPAPDPYLRALELLSRANPAMAPLDPARCMAVEDSLWGIDAAHAAGMKVIAVTTAYPPERLQTADLVVTLFEDLSLDLFDAVIQKR